MEKVCVKLVLRLLKVGQKECSIQVCLDIIECFQKEEEEEEEEEEDETNTFQE